MLYEALVFWLVGHLVIPPVLYILYGFVMSATASDKLGLSPPHVRLVDTILAFPVMLIDGLYNALWLPVLCWDFRLDYAIKRVDVMGVSLPALEMVTERFSRYNEQPTANAWHRFVASKTAPFLNGKDPKGWHIREPSNTVKDAP